MGYLTNLAFEVLKQDRLELTDDEEKIPKLLDALYENKFRRVTKDQIVNALDRTDNKLDIATIAPDLKAAYTGADKAALTIVLKAILTALKKPKAVVKDTPAPIVAISPGEMIKGGEDGTLGGFLVNNKGQIFLFGDAHVIVQDPRSSVQSNEVLYKHWPIGKIVAHSKIEKDGSSNYDIALAEVYKEFHSKIVVKYSGTFDKGPFGRSVDSVATELSTGTICYLFGGVSEVKQGKIVDTKPGIHKAKYPVSGRKEMEDTNLHGLILIENTRPNEQLSLGRQGDSGGLWVTADGKAVGLQITGGVGSQTSGVLPMTTFLKYFEKFDNTLKFLTQADVPKGT